MKKSFFLLTIIMALCSTSSFARIINYDTDDIDTGKLPLYAKQKIEMGITLSGANNIKITADYSSTNVVSPAAGLVFNLNITDRFKFFSSSQVIARIDKDIPINALFNFDIKTGFGYDAIYLNKGQVRMTTLLGAKISYNDWYTSSYNPSMSQFGVEGIVGLETAFSSDSGNHTFIISAIGGVGQGSFGHFSSINLSNFRFSAELGIKHVIKINDNVSWAYYIKDDINFMPTYGFVQDMIVFNRVNVGVELKFGF
jgi:hypothetical protein